MKNIATILTIVGCVVGAGFASGKELIATMNSNAVVPSCIIFCLVFALGIYYLLTIVQHNNINTIAQLSLTMSARLSYVIQGFFLMCYFSIVITMLATINTLMSQVIGYNQRLPIFSLLASVIVSWSLIKGNRLSQMCTIAMPIVIITVVVVFFTQQHSIVGTTHTDWSACVSYALFGSVISIASICNNTTAKVNKLVVSITSSLIISTLMYMILTCIGTYNNSVAPILNVITSPTLYCCMLIAIVLSSITSIATNSYALVNYACSIIDSKVVATAIVMTICIVLSMLGVDTIMLFIYPLLTIMALLIFTLPIIRQTKNHN